MPPSSANNAATTLADILALAVTRLKKAGIESAEFDARLLIAHALNFDRAQLLSQSNHPLTAEENGRFSAFIESRARHESVARIIGQREFWSLSFGLNEATLEPRPDSETLIEAALKNIPERNAALRVLDLGTGTGCLLLSLLHELPNATGLGIDLAPRAVEQATLNARNLKLDARAKFQVGNWLGGITETFDIVISNPPYIAHKDLVTLMPEVRDYDPHLALDGGPDGLAPYRHLIPQLPRFLNKGGLAVFEIGQGQGEDVAGLFYKNGFGNITPYNDLAGIERCIVAFMTGSPPARG